MATEVARGREPGESEVRIELSRDLRFFDITMIGVGAMIGAGIFVLTGSAARVAGPAAMVAFVLNGAVTTLTAFTYAELGSAYPEAGGGYLWAKEGLPPPAGFLSGWFSWAAHLIACALYAAAFASFTTLSLEVFDLHGAILPGEVHLGGFAFDPLEKAIAAGIVMFFMSVNYAGAHTTGKAENLITVGKMAVLGVFIAISANAMLQDPTVVRRFVDDFVPEGGGGILLAMALTFIAFEGYEIIAQSGEEVKDPKRAIPRAIFISIVVVVIFYVITFVVALGVTRIDGVDCTSPSDAWRCFGTLNDPELAMMRAAEAVAGPLGLGVMLVGGYLATTSALNATVYSSSRVSFAMGRDDSLPRFLGRVHPTRQTPANAVITSAVIIAVFAVVLPIEQIAASADVIFLLLFTIANLSLISLRRKRPDLDRGFMAPLFPYLTVLGIGLNLFLAAYIWNFPGREVGGLGPGQVAWYVALIWISVGLVYNFFAGGRQEIEEVRPRRREILEILAGARREARAGRKVLVPIRDPGDLRIVAAGARLAKMREADLVLLHVIEVPLNLPPKSVRFAYVDDRIKALRRAEEVAQEAGVSPSIVVKIAHRVYETILEAVSDEDAELLVLGWRGERPARGGRVLGTNIDFLVQRAECDVAVLKTVGMKEDLERITLYPGTTVHAREAAQTTAALARDHGAHVTVLSVIPQKEAEEEAIDVAHGLMAIMEEEEVPVEHQLVYSGSIVRAVAEATRDADLLILGAAPTWALRKYAFGALEDLIAKRAACPVLMFRKGLQTVTPAETEA